MDETIHILKLDQRPCNVHYLEHFNRFLVGTYELFHTQDDARLRLGSHLDDTKFKKSLEQLNHRAGKFVLLRGNDVSVPSVDYEYECSHGGGIFDTKIHYNKFDHTYNIYAAHSNGTVGVYNLSLHCGNKIYLKEHVKVAGSEMLTSIDLFPELIASGSQFSSLESNNLGDAFHFHQSRNSMSTSPGPSLSSSPRRLESPKPLSGRLVVGDSKGLVTVIYQGEFIQESVLDDSVWQVKSLRLVSSMDVVIVGAENCSWYIYGIDEREKRLVLLYQNSYKDFTAGVTSITILDVVHLREYDLVEVLLGSYDETIQMYRLKLNHDGTSRPDVCHKNTMTIPDGGIWRMKPIRAAENKKQLCVAAMYAGSYVLTVDDSELDGIHQSTSSGSHQPTPARPRESLKKLLNIESLDLPQKALHYDVAISSCGRTYCMVDFNNCICLFKTLN